MDKRDFMYRNPNDPFSISILNMSWFKACIKHDGTRSLIALIEAFVQVTWTWASVCLMDVIIFQLLMFIIIQMYTFRKLSEAVFKPLLIVIKTALRLGKTSLLLLLSCITNINFVKTLLHSDQTVVTLLIIFIMSKTLLIIMSNSVNYIMSNSVYIMRKQSQTEGNGTKKIDQHSHTWTSKLRWFLPLSILKTIICSLKTLRTD